MGDDRFILLPIPVSVQDVRRHMQSVDQDSVPTPEEPRFMTDLTYMLVPVSQALQHCAQLMAGGRC